MATLTEILETPAYSVNGRQLTYLGMMTSVLVNIVVLNLFVEYADNVVIDSFTISIFTAILLSGMLYVITRFEHRISDFFFERHEGSLWRIGGVAAAVWVMIRYGLLTLTVALYVAFLLNTSPITFRFQSWYADQSLSVLAIVGVLTAYGFITARLGLVTR